MKNNFTYEQRNSLTKLMAWFWSRVHDKGWLDFELEISDFDFMYSLWTNGVTSYDDKMQERLNKIRNVYLKSQKL